MAIGKCCSRREMSVVDSSSERTIVREWLVALKLGESSGVAACGLSGVGSAPYAGWLRSSTSEAPVSAAKDSARTTDPVVVALKRKPVRMEETDTILCVCVCVG